jgi:hypothetical protein
MFRIRSWVVTLLGDPATNLNLTLVPWTNKVYLPVIQR